MCVLFQSALGDSGAAIRNNAGNVAAMKKAYTWSSCFKTEFWSIAWEVQCLHSVIMAWSIL